MCMGDICVCYFAETVRIMGRWTGRIAFFFWAQGKAFSFIGERLDVGVCLNQHIALQARRFLFQQRFSKQSSFSLAYSPGLLIDVDYF
jgi:hypothetical protein